ncbi:hypothetical protein BDP27DRAFT_1370308 [Rhodocollybia butyracea]|uniref:Uncharacterized protein n=1 Tax=Rhodocollybia butyracea TaxID=206335 RepID=A0A9P5PBB1_9AGAR|nr:hypothetical protein BDP27DRAFT_1370308 [Rhodocollybia butyracea]
MSHQYYSLLISYVELSIVAGPRAPGKRKMTDISCRNIYTTGLVFASICGIAMKLLSFLRVYALFGQKRSLLILLCPFIIIQIVNDVLKSFASSAFTSQGTPLELVSSCYSSSNSLSLQLEYRMLAFSKPIDQPCILVHIIAPILGLIYDAIIFILTLVRTAHHIMDSRKSGIHSITEVILRDGTLFFFTIFIISSIDAALAIASIFPAMSQSFSQAFVFVDSFLSVLSNLLINHFVLNLRVFSDRTVQHAPSNATAPPLSMLDFAENRFLGNIGAPLDHTQWENVDELENEVEQEHGDIEWRVSDNAVDPLTTLVPVIYDHDTEGGSIRFVPMQREAGPSSGSLSSKGR